MADYLIERPEHYLELGAFYEEKRNLFIELMDPSGFEMKPSKGTYFQLADYSKISSQPDMEFARWLTVEHRIAVIPISVFYEKPPAAQLIRFCFAKEAATLREAANRLLKL